MKSLLSHRKRSWQTEEESDELKMPNIPIALTVATDFYEVADGKPVVLNYASWCPPCQAEMPDFVKAFNTYKDRVTLSSSIRWMAAENLATLRTFIKKQEMDESRSSTMKESFPTSSRPPATTTVFL